jgi:beta-galactosidase
MWRVPYQPGTLKAISYNKEGKVVLTREIHTAGPAAKMIIEPDRRHIHADGKDLSFVTIRIVDVKGTLVPHADNMIHFKISGAGTIAGMDNGNETDHESFKGDQHEAFNGLCLAVIQSDGKKGKITLTATAEGMPPVTTVIDAGE